MRLPQKLEYALRAAIELGRLGEGVTVPAGEVAERLGLPRRFVEQQISTLSRAGLVRCQRGPGGGCALARPAEDMTAGEVLRAVEGTLIESPDPESPLAPFWTAAICAFEGILDSVTLADLEAQLKRDADVDVYFI